MRDSDSFVFCRTVWTTVKKIRLVWFRACFFDTNRNQKLCKSTSSPLSTAGDSNPESCIFSSVGTNATPRMTVYGVFSTNGSASESIWNQAPVTSVISGCGIPFPHVIVAADWQPVRKYATM